MEKDLKTLIILFKAYNSLFNQVKNSLKDTTLNLYEFITLEALYHKKQLTTQQLVDIVLTPNSSLSYTLKILEEKQYIIKSRDKNDQRIQYLTLSEKGLKIFEKTYKQHYQVIRKIFDQLDKNQEKDLQTCLKIIGKYAMENENEAR